MCRNGVRKTQAHLALEPARYGMDNKTSFHNHMSKKRINSESSHQLLNSLGDLLTVDADMALDFTSTSCGPV